jgi:hypothetical protein
MLEPGQQGHVEARLSEILLPWVNVKHGRRPSVRCALQRQVHKSRRE